MSNGPLRVAAGELDAEAVMAEVTLRHDGDVYYCDTPTTLHKHESSDEMRECLDEQGYVDG